MATYSTDYQTLRQALDVIRVDELRGLAALLGIKGAQRKAEVISALCDAVFRRGQELFGRLSELEQLAVGEALHAGNGHFDGTRFSAKYRHLSAYPTKELGKGGDSLLWLFLIEGQIPVDLRTMLLRFVPEPQKDTIRYLAEAPEHITIRDNRYDRETAKEVLVRETTGAALANLSAILGLVDNGALKVGAKTGSPALASIKLVQGLLQEGDWYEDDDAIGPIQAFAWPLLVLGGGLAAVDGNRLRLTNQGRKTLQTDLAGGVKTIWQKWLSSTLFDEFSRVDAIKGQKSGGGRTMTAPAGRRPVIAKALALLETNRWISIDELGRFMQSQGLFFNMVNHEWKLYISDQQYGCLDHYNTRPFLQLRYLLTFLFEYCATLGMVDVAYVNPHDARPDFRICWGTDELPFLSRYDGLQFIRLTVLGAFTLGLSGDFKIQEQRERPYLTIRENGEIVPLEPARLKPADALFLDAIAERQGQECWRLTMTSLLRGLDAGKDPDGIADYLSRSTNGVFPAEVERLLEEVRGRAKGLVPVGRVHLLECRNRVILDMIAADKKLSKICLAAGPNFVVVLPGKEKQFLAAINSLGFSIPGFQYIGSR